MKLYVWAFACENNTSESQSSAVWVLPLILSATI